MKPTYSIKQSVKVTTQWYYDVLKRKKSPSEVTNQQIQDYMNEIIGVEKIKVRSFRNPKEICTNMYRKKTFILNLSEKFI